MAAKKISNYRRRSRPINKQSAKQKIKRNKYAMFLVIIIVVMLVMGSLYVVITGLTNTNKSTDSDQNPMALIDTNKGEIKVELYKEKTPTTCNNFIKLANDGFYDGLVFHRIANLDGGATDSHVVQGGGFYPDGNQKQSPYGSIDLEINEDVSHVDGAIAMARTTDPNSATSQFYICDGEHHYLDDWIRQEEDGSRGYAVFGNVIDGMEVVRDIASVETTTKYGMSNWPENNIIINSITIQE